LQKVELWQAERDREIAMQPFKMPAYLYDYSKVWVRLKEPLAVCDLDNIAVSTRLSRIDELAALMRELDIPQIDRAVLTGQDQFLRITQAISGYLMRSAFLGHEAPRPSRARPSFWILLYVVSGLLPVGRAIDSTNSVNAGRSRRYSGCANLLLAP